MLFSITGLPPDKNVYINDFIWADCYFYVTIYCSALGVALIKSVISQFLCSFPLCDLVTRMKLFGEEHLEAGKRIESRLLALSATVEYRSHVTLVHVSVEKGCEGIPYLMHTVE